MTQPLVVLLTCVLRRTQASKDKMRGIRFQESPGIALDAQHGSCVQGNQVQEDNGEDVGVDRLLFFWLVVTGCGKLYRARSRLYRNEILQVNMGLKALVEIYTMHCFALL